MSNPERIELNPATIRPLESAPPAGKPAEPGRTSDGKTFEEVLRTKVQDATTPSTRPDLRAVPEPVAPSTLRWSAHATARLQQRGIELTANQQSRLDTAVDKAAAKGAKDALVLLDDTALVVSVQNRTVITALGMHQARENVFTNIDSAVIA
jgi:flagellar operon protein